MVPKKKVELLIYKNNKKTKSNLIVSLDITQERLLEKLQKFTSKKFELEIFPDNGISFLLLNISQLKSLLANYKGEKININTSSEGLINDSLYYEESVSKIETPSNMSSLYFPEEKEKANIEVSKFTPSLNYSEIIHSTSSESLSQKILQITREMRQSIRNVYNQFEQICFQQLYNQLQGKDKASQVFPNKKCSQCEQWIIGTYFVCVVCLQQLIICPKCEKKDSVTGLKCHPFRNHPFAKIKRWTQQIKSKQVTLKQPNQQLLHKPSSTLKEQEELSIHNFIRTKLEEIRTKKDSKEMLKKKK